MAIIDCLKAMLLSAANKALANPAIAKTIGAQSIHFHFGNSKFNLLADNFTETAIIVSAAKNWYGRILIPISAGAMLIFSSAIVPMKNKKLQPGRYNAKSNNKKVKKIKLPKFFIGSTPRLFSKIKKKTKRILAKNKYPRVLLIFSRRYFIGDI